VCLQQQYNIYNSWAFYDICFSLRSFLKVKKYENYSNVLWRLCGAKSDLIRLKVPERLFLFLAIFGEVVLLRSVRGKLLTRIKWGKFSLNLSISMHKFLLGAGRAMWSVSEGVEPVHVTPITVWVVSNNESNCLLENRILSILIWRFYILHCYIKGELHLKSILCDTQLLTMDTLSAKCPTLNCDSSVCFGWANFANQSENCRKYSSVLSWSYFCGYYKLLQKW